MKSFFLVSAALLAATRVNASLDAKIKAKGKEYFGNVLDYNTIDTPAHTAILAEEFGVVTPEQSFKWDFTERDRGVFNFLLADNVANWATSNGKLLRGHTLVWHSQLPAWVWRLTEPEVVTEVITNHITQVAGRYKGKVYAWDVVNEVVGDSGSLRNTIFSQTLGEEFIDLAFNVAAATDPGAKLYINDYNLEFPGPKLDFFLGLVERLQERGVPVDGIGTQSHLISGKVVETYEGSLKRLGATGLDVAIVELDIRINNTLPIGQAELDQQKKDYETVTRACINLPQCVGITLWGISDKDSWIQPSEYMKFDLPLLWDREFKRKAAYDGVLAGLD